MIKVIYQSAINCRKQEMNTTSGVLDWGTPTVLALDLTVSLVKLYLYR